MEYADFWDEPGPFGTQLNSEHAFINLAMILCYVPDRRAENTAVTFTSVPANWRIAVELPKADTAENAGAFRYAAPNYDALVDAPVEIGQFDEFAFRAAGKPVRVIVHGESVDQNRVKQELSQIVEYETMLMGDVPFAEYMFLYHVGRAYGGGGMDTQTVPRSQSLQRRRF